jgi:hypothetical protein
MPFATFALPFFAPRRWELPALAAALAFALAVDALSSGSPAWLRILGLVPGVLVGATMATRTSGPLATWVGLVLGVVVAKLVPGTGWTLDAGTTAALFAALGMGAVAWRRVRVELTYSRRVDVLCGLATLALVALALSLSWVSGRLSWPNAAAFGLGAAILTFTPRVWDLPETDSPAPGSPLGRSGL